MDTRTKMADKIYIGIDNKRIEAKGEVLQEILERQAKAEEAKKLFEAALQAKEELKKSAIAKLAAIGLTEEEAKIIIGIG
jgi:hypothetical protein